MDKDTSLALTEIKNETNYIEIRSIRITGSTYGLTATFELRAGP